MKGSAGIDRLKPYLGTWEVRRRIIDRFNRFLITFEGQAFVTPVQFEEHGDTRSEHATLRSSRTYRLDDADDDVVVRFPNLSEFIRIGEGASQRVTHHCGPDLYRGRLFFRTSDAWAEMWHVRGPRKHYLSLAHYRRI
ncbi:MULTISPECIES: DUF6314 family protein [unclassified Rhizobium]|uniref:DUF6314 family protein n=1 Tax=unclassified Rhizobium TaxID=2613769 RepID=UPI000EAA1652|nr:MULTISPECIES: DUF6314 family protein [unclassified Rhizobium]AYG65478.1 hypothetical protein CCGE531_05340 [Rhizobium sp. CCGE531]AYG71961.1 hypothetical protein CCGE532_05335 [Rhizobium sp. CCGE532]